MKYFQTTLTLTAVLLMMLLGLSREAHAQVPQRLAYQSLVTTLDGTLVDDGQYRVTFRLYDAEKGGTALWAETQTLPVTEGLLSTMIGAEKALDLPFDKPYFLSIELESQPESGRMALSAAAYALVARDVPDSTVVRSISGLKDAIDLVAGDGIAIEQRDNQLIISAAQGLKGYGPAEAAYDAHASTKEPGDFPTEAQDEARLQDLMNVLGAGGSNTGLDAAYDAGRIVTLDDGKISLRGNGALGLELRDADMMFRDGTGNSPNFRFRVDGASTLQVYRIELDAASGDWIFANSTSGATPLRMTNSAADNLLTLKGSHVGINTVNPVNPLSVAGTVNIEGRLGIGTATPDEQLTVDGTVKLLSGGIQFADLTVQTTAAVGGASPWSPAVVGSGIFYGDRVGLGTDDVQIQLAIGDSDTGLQQEGDGELAVYTDFTERMRFTKAGKVGIGTTTPLWDLHVRNAIGFGTGFVLDNTSTGGRTWTALSTGDANTEGAGNYLIRDEQADAVRMLIGTDGKVGIGTTTPLWDLHVQNAIGFGTGFVLDNTSTGGRTWTALSTGDANTEGAGNYLIRDEQADAVRMLIGTDGKVGIGTTTPLWDLHVQNAIGFGTGFVLDNTSTGGRTWTALSTGDANTEGAGNYLIRDEQADAVRMLIGTAGNVGIGTTAPLAKLSVDGTVFIAGNNDTGFGITFAPPIDLAIDDNDTGLNVPSDGNLALFTDNVEKVRITKTGEVGIGTTTPNHPLEMASGAHVTAGGVWTNASSRAFKENIRALTTEEALSTLHALDPMQYTYKVDPDDTYLGFIAEDVPDLVATKTRKGLSAMDFVALLTKVVQQQQTEIEALKARLDMDR